jgi:hypothetical protein
VDNAGQAVSNIQQLATSSGNGLTSKTYVYYGNGNININIVIYYTNKTGTGPTNPTSQTWECPWAIIDKVGPYGCYADSILGNVYNTSTVAIVTWNQTSYQQIANMVNNALQNLIKNLPPGLLPPGVVSPPGFHNKFIHNSGALAGVPIIGAPPSIPISGLGSVLGSVGSTILNGVENGLKWLHL